MFYFYLIFLASINASILSHNQSAFFRNQTCFPLLLSQPLSLSYFLTGLLFFLQININIRVIQMKNINIVGLLMLFQLDFNLNRFLKKRKYRIHKAKFWTAFLMTLRMTWWNCYLLKDLHQNHHHRIDFKLMTWQ